MPGKLASMSTGAVRVLVRGLLGPRTYRLSRFHNKSQRAPFLIQKNHAPLPGV